MRNCFRPNALNAMCGPGWNLFVIKDYETVIKVIRQFKVLKLEWGV